MRRETETTIVAGWSGYYDLGTTNIPREHLDHEAGSQRYLRLQSINITSVRGQSCGIVEIIFKDSLTIAPIAKACVHERLKSLCDQKVLSGLAREFTNGYTGNFFPRHREAFTEAAARTLRAIVNVFGAEVTLSGLTCVQETFVRKNKEWISFAEFLYDEHLDPGVCNPRR